MSDTSLPQGMTPGRWPLDAAHTTAAFSVRHAGISKVRGVFNDVSGSFTLGESLEDSSVQATIAVASIDTGNADRDNHLKAADFFDAEQYPEMTFSSTTITADTMVGELTLHGQTHEVTFELDYEGAATDPFGTYRAGFSAQTEISRKEFGLTWNAALETGGVLIGDKVKITLEAEFTAPTAA